jgi:uncharacterized protein involved in exopolysaccharide biosynthesis
MTLAPEMPPLHHDRDPRAEIAPPPHPLGPVAQILRRWPLVALCVVVCAAAGVAAGVTRAPRYTSATEVNVGRIDVRVQSLPGYVEGAKSLAASYSRVATSGIVLTDAARRLGMSSAELARDVSSTSVPNSPLFRVQGTSGDPKQAMRIATVTTDVLVKAITATSAGTKAVDDAFAAYRSAERDVAGLQRQLDRLQGQARAAVGTPSTATQDRIERLRVQIASAQLRSDTYAQLYRDRRSDVSASAGVEVVSPAASAVDDRRSALQRFIVVGLLGGLVIGSALALLAGRRRGNLA